MESIIDRLIKSEWLIVSVLWEEKKYLYDEVIENIINTIKWIWDWEDVWILEKYRRIDKNKMKEFLEILNRFEKTNNEEPTSLD